MHHIWHNLGFWKWVHWRIVTSCSLSIPVLVKFIYCTKSVLYSNILCTICCILKRRFMLEIYIIYSTSDVKTCVIFLIMNPTYRPRKSEGATTIRLMNALAKPIKTLVSKPYMFFYGEIMQEYLFFNILHWKYLTQRSNSFPLEANMLHIFEQIPQTLRWLYGETGE
jgi:hypothetical protein